MDKLLLATGNKKKLEEMQAILAPSGIIVVPAAAFPDVEEPEETGSTFAENARLKSVWYSARTGLPALADDSGLVVDALDGRPGVYSSRYAATDRERWSKLLDEMRHIPEEKRTARFVCAMALSHAGRILAESTGKVEGRIAYDARGEFGFGYDPVFLLPELRLHLAEVPPEKKNQISHRARAIDAIFPDIIHYLKMIL